MAQQMAFRSGHQLRVSWERSSFSVRCVVSGDLQGALREGNSLPCSPGTVARGDGGGAFALAFGRLGLRRRGGRVPDEFTQELELGQEELPDHIPTCDGGKQHRNVVMISLIHTITQWSAFESGETAKTYIYKYKNTL